MPDIIVPRKCIGELRKLLDEVDGSVLVDLSATKIRFGLGSAILTSKLIDGTFPDYSRVIPTGNDKLLKIDPRSFEDGVDRVATIATEKTRAVKMALDRDKITLSVTSPERSEEHTSELQSLMRISYAVFCLKKKKKQMTINIQHRKQKKQKQYQ